MYDQLVIIGAGGHGEVIADIAKKNGYTDIVFLDDNLLLKKCGQYAVCGSCADIEQHRGKCFVVAIGNNLKRQEIQEKLIEAGERLVTLIHPNAVVGEGVSLGEGTVVMAGAVINPYCKIGKGCIVNTCASVDHDCIIGDYAHVSVGAHLAGYVVIGEKTWVGIGAVVSNNIQITDHCMIGAGAVVLHDLMESATYIGIPAKKMSDEKKKFH